MGNYLELKKEPLLQPLALKNCVYPLLKALNWKGNERLLSEAMPYFSNVYSTAMFSEIFVNLNFKVTKIKVSLAKLDERLLPCLFVNNAGYAVVLLAKNDHGFLIFDGQKNIETHLNVETLNRDSLKGLLYIFNEIKYSESTETTKISWWRKIFRSNKSLLCFVLFFTLITNILLLAIPFFTMAVYDKVISTASFLMLVEFSFAAGMIIVGLVIFQRLRSYLLAVLSVRMDKQVGDSIFERLLYLAPSYTETATVGAQVARIRDFDRLREFITGPLFPVLFELPFVSIGLLVIAVLGGALVLVPIFMGIMYLLLNWIIAHETKKSILNTGNRSAKVQEFLLESISKLRAIKYTNLEKKWIERYREVSADSAYASFRITLLSSINMALSDIIMIGSGMAIIALGALKIIHNSLSVGALIAIMMLTWRVLAPLKMLFNALPRVQQVKNSFLQISRLLAIEPESKWQDLLYLERKEFRGDVSFYRVSFRYQTAYDPTLIGVTFDVPRGSLVGIVGQNGSGKTTLLKLLMGLYQPQAGGIRIDNNDIRQMNPINLRQNIAYLSQSPELFYGTIAQNLRLVNPVASDEELKNAADQAGILSFILSLPEGFDTMIKDNKALQLPLSFQQSLCLARVYLRRAPIIILDEPGTALDEAGDNKLLKMIQTLRGSSTILMVTHRPSHLQNVDKILLLHKGQLLAEGKPNELLPKIAKELL